MAEYKIKKQVDNYIQKGHRLVQALDFINYEKAEFLREGDIHVLKDQDNNFLGKMIVGRQNKGLGWIFTTAEDEYWNEYFIDKKLKEAIQKRQNLFSSTQTTAFRIFNGEGDGIGGITIDYYQTYLLINVYSQGLYSYIDDFLNSLESLLAPLGIYVTLRFERENIEKNIYLARGTEASQPLIIKENNIKFAIYLGEDWMTGIFLDQRQVREFVKIQSQELRVLNLFSYTGAFSVAAALGGAAQTVSVDIANRSLERTSEQFNCNNLTAPSDQHIIRVMDVFDYINFAQRHQLTFDMIICDPPSFARNKKKLFSVEKDYFTLASQLFSILEVGGYLVLSTNHSGYPLGRFRQDMVSASQLQEGVFFLIQQFELPEDFPTTEDSVSNYLKVLVFYRQE